MAESRSKSLPAPSRRASVAVAVSLLLALVGACPPEAADAGIGEFFVTNLSNVVTSYGIGARGNVKPTEFIGVDALTGLDQPFGIAVDQNGNIYVANAHANSITIYAPGTSGNVKPIATIQGPDTLLDLPRGVAVDCFGFLYVTNSGNDSVTVYPPVGPRGQLNERPRRTIVGPDTGLSRPFGGIAAPERSSSRTTPPTARRSTGTTPMAMPRR